MTTMSKYSAPSGSQTTPEGSEMPPLLRQDRLDAPIVAKPPIAKRQDGRDPQPPCPLSPFVDNLAAAETGGEDGSQ